MILYSALNISFKYLDNIDPIRPNVYFEHFEKLQFLENLIHPTVLLISESPRPHLFSKY